MSETQINNPVGIGRSISDQRKIEVMLPIYHDDVDHPELDHLMIQEINMAAAAFSSQDQADHDPTWPDHDDFVRIFVDVTDFDRMRRRLAASYCRRFGEHLSRSLGFPLGLEFKKLLDRRAYAASPVRILATLPLTSAIRLFRLSEAAGHGKLRQLLINGCWKGSR